MPSPVLSTHSKWTDSVFTVPPTREAEHFLLTYFFAVLGIERRTSHTLSKYSYHKAIFPAAEGEYFSPVLPSKKRQARPGMMMFTSGGRGRRISMSSRPVWSTLLSSRTARTTQRDTVSKQNKQTKTLNEMQLKCRLSGSKTEPCPPLVC